jgi:ABC-type lipopolysaccharide export system ATPase subunit
MRPDVMLFRLGFPYPKQQQYVSSLSGGEMRRLHLASVLALKPNFLILDEPTNDLDLMTIEACSSLCGIVSFVCFLGKRCLRVVAEDWEGCDTCKARAVRLS